MKKLLSMVAAIVLALGLTTVVSTPAQAAVKWTMGSPFAREIVRRDQSDSSPYDIQHVRELQYRLRWAGVTDAQATGYFGRQTERAVKRFQRRLGLRQSGVADYRVWRPLIEKTVQGKRFVPHACKRSGWHACYNRWRNQVNLYRNGTLHNSWLVRGGASGHQTRTGQFTVFQRDKDHRSAIYDDAPMPYSQFFSGGQALHGSRYMMDPFEGHSHGCVNFYVKDARQLWSLTHDKTLRVHVYGPWS